MAQWGLVALMALAAFAVAVRGGRREWAGALVMLAAGTATLFMPPEPRAGFSTAGLLAVDVAGLAILGRLAWKAPNAWPVWVMAAEAVAAAATVAFLLQPDVGAETYLRGLLFTRYAMAAALLFGIRRSSPAHP